MPACPYGSRCYRRNPVHFQEYSHDNKNNDSDGDDDDGGGDDNRPECQYGTSCYRFLCSHILVIIIHQVI